MTEKMLIDKLDSYEKELCESGDPADHTALLMRLMMKKHGVNPDTCKVTKPYPSYVSLSTTTTPYGKFVEVKGDELLSHLMSGSRPWKEFRAKVDGELWLVVSVGQAGEGTVRLQLQPTSVDDV